MPAGPPIAAVQLAAVSAVGLAAIALVLLAGVILQKARRDRTEVRLLDQATDILSVVGDDAAPVTALLRAAMGNDMERGSLLLTLRPLGTAARHQLPARFAAEPGVDRLDARLERLVGSRRADRRAVAAWLLALLERPRAVARLLDLVQSDPDPEVRLAAAGGLSRSGDPDAVDALAEVLREGALPSARVIERLADPWMAPRIVQVLEEEGDPAVRAHLLTALALMRAEIGADRALAGITSGSALERGASAALLGRIADERSGGALAAALADQDGNVRLEAARALGRLHEEAAIPELVAALQDASWMVRNEAARALAGMGEAGVAGLFEAAGDESAPGAEHAREWIQWWVAREAGE